MSPREFYEIVTDYTATISGLAYYISKGAESIENVYEWHNEIKDNIVYLDDLLKTVSVQELWDGLDRGDSFD